MLQSLPGMDVWNAVSVSHGGRHDVPAFMRFL